MPKQIIIAEQHRIAAVFSEDQIQELIVATGSHQVGDIYLGIVENVLPGIDAAFVNIGDTERNGFIHVSDLGPLKLRRSSGAITELVAPQQKVLVQIMKEPTGTKGPRLTGNVSLPGRYLVLMPSGRGVNLSRRITKEDERGRLRALGILIKPAGMGLLVRTEAEGISEDAIIEDLELLQKQWESVQQQANSTRPPALLNRDNDFIQRVLRDVYNNDVNRIVVDSGTGLKRVKQHLLSWNTNRLPQGVLVDQHRESASILEYFRVNAAIREALKPRVDLPSGGYIIIEKTEALTVIDVNSGSFTRSATARETVLWTNCEAATEIARQLRLRNIAGVIIVDFIDMDSRRDQLQVLEHFNKALKADKARPQIAQLSELGLVELTRKRQGQNIYELFGSTCPTCGGLGHLAHLPGTSPELPGESVERYMPNRSASSRTASPSPLPDSVGNSLNLGPGNNLQELDLTNHPSYQEKGGPRKRRRRARLGDSLSARESLAPRLVRGNSSGNNSERSPLPRSVETRGSAPIKSNGSSRRSNRADTLVPKTEAPPPEAISVTMTPEEQVVYGFMGVSPLILHGGTVKDPKSAIVTVVVPGGTATEVANPSPSSSPVQNAPVPSPEPDDVPSPVVPADSGASNGSDQPPDAGSSASPAPPILASSTPPPEAKAAAVEEEKEESSSRKTSPTRRRRRRSSSRAKQLSLETDS